MKSIRNRIYKGWDIERAINTPLNVKNQRSGYYLYNGMTIAQYLKYTHSDLTTKAIYTRLRLGWSLNNALHTPKGDPNPDSHRKRRIATYNSKHCVRIKGNKNTRVTSNGVRGWSAFLDDLDKES